MAEQTALELIDEASELLSKIHPDLLSIIKTMPKPSPITFSQLVPITSKQIVPEVPLTSPPSETSQHQPTQQFQSKKQKRITWTTVEHSFTISGDVDRAASKSKGFNPEKVCYSGLGKPLEKLWKITGKSYITISGSFAKLPILAGVAKTAGNNEGLAKTAGNTGGFTKTTGNNRSFVKTAAACNHVRMLDQALNYLETGSGFTNLSMENAIVEIFVMISPAHFSKIQIALEILTGTHSSPKYASKNAALVGQSAEGSTAKSFFESLASSSSSIKRGTSWPSCGASSSTGQTNLRESRYSSEFGLWPWQRGHGRRLRRHHWQRMGTDIVDSRASGLAEKGLGKAEKGKKVKTKKWRRKKCELRSRVKNVKLRSANIEILGISRRERY
ncbi:hypothetical protein V8G54_031615 [Vigna mungo]|uniref:Uncharacterized protein n=1 Tax=Vigna mungo TaxID=3915 RepID=A0AAQ3MK32_VIGMU